MFDIVGTAITLLSYFGIYGILALSLNMEYGLSGQLNLGQVFFFGLGAYSAGLTTSYGIEFATGTLSSPICSLNALQERVQVAQNDPALILSLFVASLIVGGVVAAVFGFASSYPALRVREEFYLGLILLVVAEIFQIIMENIGLACGYNGLSGVYSPFSWISNPVTDEFAYAVVILLILAVSFLLIRRISNSPFGRLMKGVRDDDIATSALGKPVQKVRGQVMLIGSLFAGLAGVLYAYYVGLIAPNDFVATITFDVWLMMLLGGKGNNVGVLAGAAIVTVIDRATQTIPLIANFNLPPADVTYLSPIILGVILLVTLRVKRNGILPEQPLRTPSFESKESGEKHDTPD